MKVVKYENVFKYEEIIPDKSTKEMDKKEIKKEYHKDLRVPTQVI